jgi:hypothetical protein
VTTTCAGLPDFTFFVGVMTSSFVVCVKVAAFPATVTAVAVRPRRSRLKRLRSCVGRRSMTATPSRRPSRGAGAGAAGV